MQGTHSRQLCTLGNNAQPHRYQPISMNLKRIFGALLTVLGIVGLIYGAVMFVNDSKAIKALSGG